MANPNYIIVTNGKFAAGGKMYKVLRLAQGNEHVTMPIYHPIVRDRARASLTAEEARQRIQWLTERDELSSGIRQGQAGQAGFGPVPEDK